MSESVQRARHQAKRSVRSRLAQKETVNPAIIAKGGNGNGTAVITGRPGWAYVRLHGDDNQLTEAKVGIALEIADLDDAWLRVRKASPKKASYYVVEEFVTSSAGDPTPPLSSHALDPDDGPHTGPLSEDDVTFGDGGHAHGGGGDGQQISLPDVLDPQGQLLTGAQRTDLTDGGTTSLHQHAGAVTANVEITLTNRTGGQRVSGDVVVIDAANDESFTGTNEAGYQGKVLVVAETIANLTTGLCWERGGPFDVKVTGAVSRTDGLRTSTTTFRAEAAPSLTGGGVFAVALSENISGDGTVKALFLDEVVGASGGTPTIEIQEDDGKVADASIVNFEGGGGKVTDEGGGKVTVDITPGAGGSDKGVIWVYPGGITGGMTPFADNIGDFATRGAAENVDVFFNFPIPTSFSSLDKAVAVFIAVNTDNTTFDLASDYGADGEAYNTHSESETTGAYNNTINKIYEVDVSGILSAIAAGDYVGITIDKNSVTALLKWIGLLIEYTKA